MTRLVLILSTLLAVCFQTISAQETDGMPTSTQQPTADSLPHRPWEEMLADMATNDDLESEEWEETYMMLCDLEQSPLDINTATRQQLESLPFLSAQQVEDIQYYIYKYGRMASFGELAMIPSIDYPTRQLLSYFITIKEEKRSDIPLWRNILRYGRHDIMATANVPFYERHGDKEGYLGYPYRHHVRYQWSYSNRLKIGILGAQDAGEPFFANRNGSGYDFYSFYAEAHHIGRMRDLVAGRYRAAFGMGLVTGNTFATGKLSVLTNQGNKDRGLTAHTSRSSRGYLQGAGATVQLYKGLDMSAFVSYRKRDATLADSSGIATFVDNGYHRTKTEMDKKNNCSETTAGAHVRWSGWGFHLGTTGVYTAYDKALRPDTSVRYKHYYPMGKTLWNASVDYGYTGHSVSLHGETAIGDGGGMATVNTVNYSPSSALSLTALYRFYSKKYHAPHASSMSEGSRVQNESGIYLGGVWRLSQRLRVTAYTDYAYFPFARYYAMVPSHTWDNLVQAQYNTEKTSLSVRYQVKVNERDNTEKTQLVSHTTHRARVTASTTLGGWTFSTVAAASHSHYEANSLGWMVNGNIGYSHQWLSLNAGAGYFDTDDYDSRVTAYEKGLSYTYSYITFSGQGLRAYLSAKAAIHQRITVQLHLSTTHYTDRDHISSGYQQIDRSTKTDLEMQVKLRL